MGDRSPSSSTNSTSASSVSDSVSTPLSAVDEASLEPCGPLGEFLFTLLFALPQIKEFFSAGPAAVAARVLARGDARLEILKKYGPRFRELPISAKFERFLTDRSLALSYERSKQSSSQAFVKLLYLTSKEDESLVLDATYHGNAWRAFEEEVREPGISAVACCEHSLFKKGVPRSDMKKCAEFLEQPPFKSILQLARSISNNLNIIQDEFDKAMGVEMGTGSTHERQGGCPPQAIANGISSPKRHSQSARAVPLSMGDNFREQYPQTGSGSGWEGGIDHSAVPQNGIRPPQSNNPSAFDDNLLPTPPPADVYPPFDVRLFQAQVGFPPFNVNSFTPLPPPNNFHENEVTGFNM
ncbi:hypothetical protein K469DRAFT_695273 [Zopfia rhizophila CBS 207.26]|uniref:Uncharacterized protein n=1 Tax=Zopfia rhizophila CBS 207.26 TaxID=1314779 RepID=A0A6A6DLD5_9PEZI|nr:hypothetical protein K469DRAFT_695273 [Zopfia rhizophila CBS 207.26]